MTRGRLRLPISLIFAAFLAGCGNVTPVGNDGGPGGTAGASATGKAGSTGAAGSGSAGTGSAGTGAAGTGSAGTGVAGTGAAGTGSAGTGAAGTGSARPCVDTMCPGACAGTSCDGPWTCDAMASCIEIAAQYCGCDGKTFTASGCSPRAFAHRGACEAGVSCDQSKIQCKRLAPACPAGQVPSLEGICYGNCVKIEECTCAAPADCPEPDHYTCHNNTKRCGPFVR